VCPLKGPLRREFRSPFPVGISRCIHVEIPTKGLELYFAVGDYVLNTFFGEDPETFHTRGKGHATFPALAEREDLRLGFSALYKAVAVVEQRRLLPDNLASVLSLEHQVKLLPVKDENEKVELARRAVQEELSSRD